MNFEIRLKKTLNLAMVTGLTVVLILGIGVAPTIANTEPEKVDQMLAAIEDAAPGTLRSNAELDAPDVSDEDESVWRADNGDTVAVATDATDGVTVNALDRELQVELPFSDKAEDAVAVDSTVVAFDNGNDSTTIPVAHEDGSVQIFTIIESAEAPTRYEYGVTTPGGGALTELENGAILVTGSDGSFSAVIAPAWAKDASGAPVPTHYEIDGTRLTQVVEHTAAAEYPIVADPWLGIRLFLYVSRNTYQGDYRYNGYPTIGGALVLSGGGGVGTLAGGAIFRAEGWDE